MNKMQSWFTGPPVDVLTDPETQSDRSGSPGHSNPTPPSLPTSKSNRPPPSPAAASLTRLPSDDTLNRSSHGKNSIEELRSSNSALIHQLSTQEASFMNQLSQCSEEFGKKEQNYKRELNEVNSALQVQHSRVSSLEKRIRERDAQLTSCKEERGRMGCQITDLKNQLYQLQFEIEETSADKADSIQSYESKLTDATRSIDEMKRALDEATTKQVESETRVDELQKENEKMVRQLKDKSHDVKKEDYEALLQKVKELEHQNTELEQQNTQLQAQAQDQSTTASLQQQLSTLSQTNSTLEERLSTTTQEMSHTNKISQKEISSLRSMLLARDDAIQSLQSRLERSSEQMTTLEAEVDSLREVSKVKEGKQGELGNLWKLNDEMAKIIEKQSKKVEELNDLLDTREDKLKEVIKEKEDVMKSMGEQLENKELEVVEVNEELIKLRKEVEGAQMESGEAARKSTQLQQQVESLRNQLDLEREASSSAAQQESTHHGRISSLECELGKMNEKVDELTESLAEALEEVHVLQGSIGEKEGRIEVLERELEEATAQLDKAQTTSDDNSGKFNRLRTEIENVTRERVRLESQHATEISNIKSQLDEAHDKLRVETEKVSSLTLEMELLQKTKDQILSELDEANAELKLADNAIDAELEQVKQKLQQHQESNAKLQSENETLRAQISSSDELREAQQALIALDEERSGALKDSADRIKKLSMSLSDCEEQVVASEAKLNRAIREREFIISDLKKEVQAKEEYANQLKRDLEAVQLQLDRSKSPCRAKRSFGMAIDPDCDDDADLEVSRLKVRLSNVEKERDILVAELRAKIDDRDKSISSLVMTSTKQEGNIAGLRKEVARLQLLLETESKTAESALTQRKNANTDALKQEVESLKGKLREMSSELSRANKKVSSLTQELERAKDQLSTTETTQDVADLAGRLAVADQAQRMMRKDNEEKLKERDAAISNLLQTVHSNEKKMNSLMSELEVCKRNVEETLEENKRLQHESEIFAAQIIDQDEEFADLNDKLKEKNAEIASMSKSVASSKTDARKIASLQRRLDDLKDEKENLLERVDDLTQQLHQAESANIGPDEFEVERLRDDLKIARADKAATEDKLSKQIESLRKLRNHAVDDFEAKLKSRDNQIASLEKEILDLKEEAQRCNAFDIDLNGNPAPTQEQLDEMTDKCVKLGEEKDELRQKIAALNEEIETLKSIPSESKLVSELKTKLAQSEAMREAAEKNRSMFTSDRDAEINRLHKQLSEAKEKQSTRETEQSARLKVLEKDNHEMREDFNIRIKEKNARIIALEQTLAAQEQVVGNMSSEMDQLQNGMEKVSVQRRAEIEEMQQELMDYTSKATRLEREVASLSMTLNEKKHKHRAEVEKLRSKISALESESPFARDIRHKPKDDDREKIELTEKIEHMKWLNSTLKDENDKLQEKLERATMSTKRDESSASAKNNDKWRNVQLQEQVAVLSQRVIELEEAASSSEVRAPGSPRKTSILESPVMRSTLNTAPATPRSSLRVSSYDQVNQANEDLLSNSARGDNTPAKLDGAPPPLPNRRGSPSRASMPNMRNKSSKMPSIGNMMKRGSNYKMSPKPSPRMDDASNSTTNYNF